MVWVQNEQPSDPALPRFFHPGDIDLLRLCLRRDRDFGPLASTLSSLHHCRHGRYLGVAFVVLGSSFFVGGVEQGETPLPVVGGWHWRLESIRFC